MDGGRRRTLHRSLGLALLLSTAALVVLMANEWRTTAEQLGSLAQVGGNVGSGDDIVALEAIADIFFLAFVWLLVAIPLVAAWRRTRYRDDVSDDPP